MPRISYLMLLGATGLLLGGCTKGSEPAPAPVYLLDRQWQLLELQGQPVPATAESRTSLTLSSTNNTNTGLAFCNQYGGGFTMQPGNNALGFSPQASTNSYCSAQPLETRYLELLPQVRRYLISNRHLQLYDAEHEQPVLVFEVGK
ncbi:META domain-containing protein [Hymenobacter amundsenii]|nr:META domain-containing protein [Hymenobacter amundsenii]